MPSDLLQNKRVLVSGGSGYLASHLISTLKKQSVEVLQLNRREDLDKGIYSSEKYLKREFKFTDVGHLDLVFHLAAVYSPNSDSETFYEMMKSNLDLSANLIFDANMNSVPMILAGSYTQNAHGESNNSMTLYAALKNSTEVIADYFVRNQGLVCATTRIYESYGYDDERSKLLYRLIDAALMDNEIILPNTDLELNYVAVNEITDALIQIALSMENVGKLITYEISTSNSIKLTELMKKIESIVGRTLKVSSEINPRSHFNVTQTWSCGEKIPGWSPKSSLENDLKHLILNRTEMLKQRGHLI